jgi:hypothetical protein
MGWGRVFAALGALLAAFLVVCAMASAASNVALNDPEANGPTEPSNLGPGGDYVQAIKWSTWGSAQATGEGKLAVCANEGPLDPALYQCPRSPVEVMLGGLATCDDYSIYTTYELSVQPGVPTGPDWSSSRTRRFPCKVSASNYQPGTKADAEGDCESFFVDTRGPLADGFCRMDWRGFGTRPITIGKGVARNGLDQWAAEVVLSDIQWCPTGLEEDALSYTHMTMSVYGKPEEIVTGHKHTGPNPYNITVSEADHLRRDIGRPGFKKKTYRTGASFVRGCIPLTTG